MPKILRILVFVLAGWYLALCAQHYLNQRPLWNDEQCVLNSIQHFQTSDFFLKPLENIQIFPRVYLLTIQIFAELFDFSLLSLRALPFVIMVAAFFIWLTIVRRELKDTRAYLVYILCWGASISMVYYAAELKQYSMDVLVAGLFTFFICCQDGSKTNRPALHQGLLYVLPFFAFFSYITYLFTAVVFYNLAVDAWQKQRLNKDVFCYGLLCVGIFVSSYVIDMRFTPRDVYSLQGHGAYFIRYDSIGAFFETAGEGVNNLFSRWYAESPKVLRKIGRFFAVFGLVYMFGVFFKKFKAERYRIQSLSTLGFTLFLGQIALAMMHKYPLGQPRTSLFFAPFVFYFTVQGISALASINKYAYRGVMVLFVIFLLFVSIGLAGNVFILGDLGAQAPIWK